MSPIEIVRSIAGLVQQWNEAKTRRNEAQKMLDKAAEGAAQAIMDGLAEQVREHLSHITDRINLSERKAGAIIRACAAGITPADLKALAEAKFFAEGAELRLPAHHFEGLSRGRGWCRLGRGESTQWGRRVGERGAGYIVSAPGRWHVGGFDGFTRKREDVYQVDAIRVGAATWLIAN